MLTTIGPRSDEIDVPAAAQAGQGDVGQPAVHRAPSPARHLDPGSALICRSSGVSTSISPVPARAAAGSRGAAGQHQHGAASAATARLMRAPRCATSAAATSGSVGPSP